MDYCLYMDQNNRVYNITGTDKPFPCIDGQNDQWLPGPVYEEDNWKRYTPQDPPFGFDWFWAGARPWNESN